MMAMLKEKGMGCDVLSRGCPLLVLSIRGPGTQGSWNGTGQIREGVRAPALAQIYPM